MHSKNNTWTDDTLVRAIQSGGADRDNALQHWFSQPDLKAWVVNYAANHGGSKTDGVDLYHDSFLTFDRLIRAGKFRGEAALRTFFCSIAKWQWLNRQRKLGRNVAINEQDLLEIGQFPEEEMYQRERQVLFQTLLSQLGEKCKRLLTLYQLSYSMKEIAAEMGYSSDQVAMNQCSECRKKLKTLIENDHELLEAIQY